MLHKFRTAMDPSGHQQLSGQVEVDETFIGGKKTVLKGRGAAGKMLVAGAVERKGSGPGRARLQIIPDATTPILTGFLRTTFALGPMVTAYGWTAYPPACKAVGLMHTAHKVTSSGQPAHVYLPGVHRIFALARRVLGGTYQGSVQPEHLQSYLDEFVFRFNRRRSTERGLLFFRLLEAAESGVLVPYDDLALIRHKPLRAATSPSTPHHQPRTLTGPPADRPWRTKNP